ncbi:uncharacterized protein LOC129598122 [Paramacrobiotus metropolitanus]|uniref:uncharacterized protein LOC129598122 n=1 Tax=Paramacrobiotus metropolitanus TaxID=2943436 RepID=UPI002445F6E7|nr:uncharacterized protein LOC129598122 [Paramacrobiotus metropolitanus]
MASLSLTTLVVVVLTVPLFTTAVVDLSSPAFTVPYDGRQNEVFQAEKTSADPTFFFAPMATLLSRSTKVMYDQIIDSFYLELTVKMWNEDYAEQIKAYIRKETGTEKIRILPLPFKWMHLEYSFGSQYARTPWEPITSLPETLVFRIRCATSAGCSEAQSVLQNGTDTTFTVRLHFAYRPPSYLRKLTIVVNNIHLQEAPMFRTVTEQFAEFVFLRKKDYSALLQQVLNNCLDATLEPDEFVDHEQFQEHLTRLLPAFRKNITVITSATQFTAAMWQATYLPEQRHPVDVTMYCLDLHRLREQENFRTLTIRASKLHTDYSLAATTNSASLVSSLQYQINRMRDAMIPPVGSIQPASADMQTACWLRCNGQPFNVTTYPQLASILSNGKTPNLEGQFLVGSDGSLPVGSRGGEKEHYLTVNEMPAHQHGQFLHTVGWNDDPNQNNRFTTFNGVGLTFYVRVQPDITNPAGGNQAHNNMPPYQAVVYLIRAC